MQLTYDLVIVGGGIVGAATAWQAKQAFPDKKILLLEKELNSAMHQTGRNSGVIHAGVYYPPGSLKSQYCIAGLRATIDFCQQHQLPYQQCGKLIVATNPDEESRLNDLYLRSQANELDIERVSASKLQSVEPNIIGTDAILVRDTGITDYAKITTQMLALFRDLGGQVCFGEEVEKIEHQSSDLLLITQHHRYQTRFMVNCAGLMADRLIKMTGITPDFQIVPFKGEYFQLPAKYNKIVSHLIYPVPDPKMPFLGVHLTRMIDGTVTVGPNAVLALAREGYDKMQMRLSDTTEMLGFGGFWKVLWQHKVSAMQELKNSLSKKGYLQQVRKYCPQIQLDDLTPYPSGIRAQAVSNSGKLIHDFKFVESDISLHVGNAPSPAATSAIPIAKAIIEKLHSKIG